MTCGNTDGSETIDKELSQSITLEESLTKSKMAEKADSVNYGVSVMAGVEAEAGAVFASAKAKLEATVSAGGEHTWTKSSGEEIETAESRTYEDKVSIAVSLGCPVEVLGGQCVEVSLDLQFDSHALTCTHTVQFDATYDNGDSLNYGELSNLFAEVGYKQAHKYANNSLQYTIESKGNLVGKSRSVCKVASCPAIPTAAPTPSPTATPTAAPTSSPTAPTLSPTATPTAAPT
jgi:hypothetical protein